jgi:hypothetical protein
MSRGQLVGYQFRPTRRSVSSSGSGLFGAGFWPRECTIRELGSTDLVGLVEPAGCHCEAPGRRGLILAKGSPPAQSARSKCRWLGPVASKTMRSARYRASHSSSTVWPALFRTRRDRAARMQVDVEVVLRDVDGRDLARLSLIFSSP